MSIEKILEIALTDTLLGMGTVFSILIFIALIISCFKYVPFLHEKVEEPKEVLLTEEPEEELVEDAQLVAVIMAAIRAYEEEQGAPAEDEYVVRSVRRSTWKHTLSE